MTNNRSHEELADELCVREFQHDHTGILLYLLLVFLYIY
jgi:hypothetical protein